MGLPSSGISSTDGAPLVYVASESTALNTWFQNLESCLGDDFFFLDLNNIFISVSYFISG